MSYHFLNNSLNPIDQNQCIGDTLDTFNSNFLALDTSAFSLSTVLVSLSSQINNIQDNDSMYLTADNDSAYVVSTSPSVAKAWVVFDGSTTVPTIKSSYNVISVTRGTFVSPRNAGNYKIIYSINLPDTNYAVFATSTDFGSSGYNIALQSYNSGYPANTYNSSGYKTVSSVNIGAWVDGGNYTDDGDISVIIFDN